MTSAVLRWVPEHIRGLRTTEYDNGVPGADGYGDVTRQRGPILTSATEPVFTLDLAAVLPR